MNYLGYEASVEFDGKTFCGTIKNIDDLVTFEGDTPEDLEREFRAAVDDYLDFCRVVGKDISETARAV